MSKRIAWWLVAVLSLIFAGRVSAQLVDDVEVRAVGNRAEATLKLAAQVRLVRTAVSSSGKTLQIFFQITQADESVARIVEEARRSPPNAPVAPFTARWFAAMAMTCRRRSGAWG